MTSARTLVSMKNIRLYPSALWFALSAALWMAFSSKLAGGADELVLIGVFIALGAGGLSLINWIAATIAARYRDFETATHAAEAELIHTRLQFVKTVQQLTPDQLDALGKFRATIGVIPGINTDPLFQLQIGGVWVPWDFVQEFLDRGSETHLAEVRGWAEGGKKREYAQILTAFFVANHFAEPAAGNQSAAWRDRVGGLLSIGYSQNESEII
jgi:hypothetical protein